MATGIVVAIAAILLLIGVRPFVYEIPMSLYVATLSLFLIGWLIALIGAIVVVLNWLISRRTEPPNDMYARAEGWVKVSRLSYSKLRKRFLMNVSSYGGRYKLSISCSDERAVREHVDFSTPAFAMNFGDYLCEKFPNPTGADESALAEVRREWMQQIVRASI